MGTTNFDTVQGVILDPDGNRVTRTKTVKVALGSAADTGGAVLAFQNHETTDIHIDRIRIKTTVKSTGASTVDFGTTAASATTSSDNLIDGVDLGTAVGIFDNMLNAGTNGKGGQSLAAGKWLTGSRATGAVAGLVGHAYITYTVLD